MKFTCAAKDLRAAIHAAAELTDDSLINSSSGRLLLSVQEPFVTVTAFNVGIEVSLRVSAKIERPGNWATPAQAVVSFVKALPAEAEVQVEELPGGGLQLKCNRSRIKVPALPASGFPSFRRDWEPEALTMASADLVRAIDAVLPAIKRDQVTAALSGLHLHVVGDKLRAVGCDGARLHVWEIDFEGDAGNWRGLILPRAVLSHVRRLAKRDVSIALTALPGYVKVECGNARILTLLINDVFPAYQGIVPVTPATVVEIDAAELAEAVGRVRAACDERTGRVSVEIDSELTLRTANSHGNEAEDTVGLLLADGPKVTFALNVHYLSDAAGIAGGEPLRISTKSPSEPVMISPAVPGAGFVVISPMR